MMMNFVGVIIIVLFIIVVLIVLIATLLINISEKPMDQNWSTYLPHPTFSVCPGISQQCQTPD